MGQGAFCHAQEAFVDIGEPDFGKPLFFLPLVSLIAVGRIGVRRRRSRLLKTVAMIFVLNLAVPHAVP